MAKVDRQTVDLSQYPNLVVIYLGMRVNAWTGLKTLAGMQPSLKGAIRAKPDGLLLHEEMLFSMFPPHVAMRQYWRDYATLEAWTRSAPHRDWWQRFLSDSGGTGFWHEAYFMRGGMEAIYDDTKIRSGFAQFAPMVPARGRMFSARARAGMTGETPVAPVPETQV